MRLYRVKVIAETVGGGWIINIFKIYVLIFQSFVQYSFQMKNNGISGEENMRKFMKKLSELKPLTVPEEFAVDHLDEFPPLTRGENLHIV